MQQHWNHLPICRMRGSSLFWYFIGVFTISQFIIVIIFHRHATSPYSPFHHHEQRQQRQQQQQQQQQQHRQRVSPGAVSRQVKNLNTNHHQQQQQQHHRHRRRPDIKNHNTVRGGLILREKTNNERPKNAGADPDADGTFDSIQAKARAYAHSFTRLGRGPLNFFHIPKTAGTAIEEAAAERSIPWGSCRFHHKPKREVCPYPSGHDWPRYVGWWHLPAYLFPLVGTDPYRYTDLFAVVRDPYERMVSEFYYTCTLKIKDWRPDQCDNRTRLFDEAYMNQWLRKKLNESGSPTRAEYYLADNSHFTPQYEFLVGPHEVRIVDYVLRMDDPALSLSEQFDRLVEAHGMPSGMSLPFMGAISAEARNTTDHLTVDNLQPSTLDQIHRHYEKDLEYLRYAKKGR